MSQQQCKDTKKILLYKYKKEKSILFHNRMLFVFLKLYFFLSISTRKQKHLFSQTSVFFITINFNKKVFSFSFAVFCIFICMFKINMLNLPPQHSMNPRLKFLYLLFFVLSLNQQASFLLAFSASFFSLRNLRSSSCTFTSLWLLLPLQSRRGSNLDWSNLPSTITSI